MAAHGPLPEQGWVWLKAASGILVFKGVLTVVGAKADHAAVVARRIAEGEAAPELLAQAVAYEWATLAVLLALAAANVVIGVWRPRLGRRRESSHTGLKTGVGSVDTVSQRRPDSKARGWTRPAA